MKLIQIDWCGIGSLIPPSWSEVQEGALPPPYPHELYFRSGFHYVSASCLEEIEGLEEELKWLHAECSKNVGRIWELLGQDYGIGRPGAIPPRRCLAYTKKGRRCKNYKIGGEDRCSVHFDIHYLDLAKDEWEGVARDEYSVPNLLYEIGS